MKRTPSEEAQRVFGAQLDLWGVFLNQESLEDLGFYTEELAAYDRANVVGTRERERLWLDHVLDSLSCLLYEPLGRVSSLIDIGSGGGMPGVPLHLASKPEKTCLLESTGKKAEFLRHLCSHLPLGGVEVAQGRAEDLGHDPGYREAFEAVTVRAVASLDVISEYCLPFLSRGGVMVAMKGRLEDGEWKAGKRAASILGASLERVIPVPFVQEREYRERNLVVVRKVEHTPEGYPRGAGTPRKKPLGAF